MKKIPDPDDPIAGMNIEQYKVVAERRTAINNLLWQTPTLALFGQSTVLGISFNHQIPIYFQVGAAIFSLLIGLAAIQLMSKLRFFEFNDSAYLRSYECHHNWLLLHGVVNVHNRVSQNWLQKVSSFAVWRGLLFIGTILNLFVLLSLIGFQIS